MRKFILSLAALVPAASAHAAPQSYAVACSSVCSEASANAQGDPLTVQAPVGYVDNVIVLDPDTAHGFAAPAGHVLIGGTGLTIGQTATSAQLAVGITAVP